MIQKFETKFEGRIEVNSLPPNLICNAGAGTGKTTTITNGVGVMKGHQPEITPTPEQRAIWDVMCQENMPGKVHLTSFSTAAAEQLQSKCPKDKEITSSSTYGMGLRQAFRAGLAGQNKGKLHTQKYEYIIGDLLGTSRWKGGERFKAIQDCVDKARLELKRQLTQKEAQDLALWYGIDIDWAGGELDVVNDALRIGLEQSHKFDYTDMVWIPNLLGVVRRTYDCLVVDEYQDMGVAQQELCMSIAWRVICIGDKHQAIYGFAGADADAYKRMGGWMGKTLRGCVTLPLKMTRRCGKAIVDDVNKALPEEDRLIALPEAPDGVVQFTSTAQMHRDLESMVGSLSKGTGPTSATSRIWTAADMMVICPTNAPLVSLIYKLQERGIRAFVASKDIADDMLRLIGEEPTVAKLAWGLQGKLERLDKKKGRAAQAKQDTIRTLMEIANKCSTLDTVKQTVKKMFPEKHPIGWMRMSSIHQAKGLEADTVVVWEWDRCNSAYSTLEWQKQQDRNLLHVAKTRAKTRLILARSEG